ncbi:MAG: MBL fold metallo-hydrolase [Candidatus Adiutrix sp.]|jgi:L-ascorbate metabolism protein UlaG (beta-lactamase superfamily)|nr:MBL fold metallo-hydrolase [Candidatus Adiutrix sp.]
MSVKTDHILWLGHDSVRLAGSRTIYIDPWEVSGPPAQILLVTHDHYDHCDPAALKGLTSPATRLFTTDPAEAKLREAGYDSPITVMEPGDELEVFGVVIKAVPAYNTNKDFHPRAAGGLGFVVTLDGLSIYHAGDTDFIPEMKDIQAQVALLPVSGTYVMTAAEAAQAALTIRPEVAIPIHYGKIVGDEEMARQFKTALAGQVAVEIKTISGGKHESAGH